MHCSITITLLVFSSLLLETHGIGCRPLEGGPECSGRGVCVNRECKCDSRPNSEEFIFGEYCECDNFSCERHNRLLCSGPDHGICECGVCLCKQNWTGSACECSMSTAECKQTNDAELCSGHGLCECGVCRCETTALGRYSGKYCERYPQKRCYELKDCVECQMHRTGLLDRDCITKCDQFVPIPVTKVEIEDEFYEEMCIMQDENNCEFAFKYSEKGGRLSVYASENKVCKKTGSNFL